MNVEFLAIRQSDSPTRYQKAMDSWMESAVDVMSKKDGWWIIPLFDIFLNNEENVVNYLKNDKYRLVQIWHSDKFQLVLESNPIKTGGWVVKDHIKHSITVYNRNINRIVYSLDFPHGGGGTWLLPDTIVAWDTSYDNII